MIKHSKERKRWEERVRAVEYVFLVESNAVDYRFALRICCTS